MKRVLCLLLVALMIAPGASAGTNNMYSSDNFFLYLPGEWEKSEENGAVVFLNDNERITIAEFYDEETSTFSKALSSLLGKTYYEALADVLSEQFIGAVSGDDIAIVSNEVIEERGKLIPIMIFQYEDMFAAGSFVIGDNYLMYVMYSNYTDDYIKVCSRVLEIMEYASTK